MRRKTLVKNREAMTQKKRWVVCQSPKIWYKCWYGALVEAIAGML
jgi:hypothetical protein